jgi:hypothetical protein
MTSAVELLKNPNLDINPITSTVGATSAARRPADDELAHMYVGSDDIAALVLKFQKYSKGKAAYSDVRSIVKDAVIEDSIDKTPTFTITMYDPDWDLISSGALDGAVDINPGNIAHRWYRLDGFDVNDDEITMTFATRNAVFLSMHKRPVKFTRGKMTRAQAIQALTKKVKIVKIDMFCPQLTKKQTQAKFTSSSEREKQNSRKSGFTDSDKITVKGATANSLQRREIGKVCEAGIDQGIPGLLVVGAVMCIIQETDAGNNPLTWVKGRKYYGTFQQDTTPGAPWPATGDTYKDAKGFFRAALPRFNSNKNQDLGQLVAIVQGVVGSTNPLNAGYAQSTNRWRAEAQHAVNAFGGIDVDDPGSSAPTTTDYRKKYEFMVGPDDGPKNENYLGAINRWAEEVNWRAYWVRDVLHYMSEEDLFKAKARIRLRRYGNGIEGVALNRDSSKKVAQITLRVRMVRWVAPVGTVVIWDEGTAKTGKGRWLVTNIRRSVFDEMGEIILKKPITEKKEPAPKPGTHTEDGTVDPHTAGTLDVIANTPKEIIDQIVLKIARDCGINKTVSQNDIDNANHKHNGSRSDHAGPPALKWAADMSDGFMTENENKLVHALCDRFGLAYSMPILGSKTSNDGKWRFQLIHGANFPPPTDEHRNHVHFGVLKLK